MKRIVDLIALFIGPIGTLILWHYCELLSRIGALTLIEKGFMIYTILGLMVTTVFIFKCVDENQKVS